MLLLGWEGVSVPAPHMVSTDTAGAGGHPHYWPVGWVPYLVACDTTQVTYLGVLLQLHKGGSLGPLLAFAGV